MSAEQPNAADRLVVVGASAGGVAALARLCGALPRDWPAAVAVVLHLAPRSKSNLPSILSRAGGIPAAFAKSEEPIERGRIYVAPPDHHLLVSNGVVRLTHGPKENRNRPSIDRLFRSAARSWGSRVIGVVLSGHLNDGTLGLAEIRRLGGIAVVQDPADAEFPSMPSSALDAAGADHQVPLGEMPTLLDRLVRRASEAMARENEGGSGAPESKAPSVFGCPDCGGVLWEVTPAGLGRYECRVGHGFSAAELLDRNEDSFEDALWAAIRALEEQSELARRLANRARASGHELSASRYEDRAQEASDRAALVRTALRGALERGAPLVESPEGSSS